MVQGPIDEAGLERYLARLDYDGPLAPDLATLRALHLRHMLRVPFENLDIHLRRPLSLETSALFAKIVERRRGGFCYELNGLFAWLLRRLGFDVRMLSARVANSGGGLGPEFDHMTLLVRLDDRWLADVGFGDSFREPLKLDTPEPQSDGHTEHRVVHRAAETFAVERRAPSGAWEPQYVFTTRAREIDDFQEMCTYHQTSPASHFTQKRTCSRATPEGRVTVSGLTLIETTRGGRVETPLADEDQWRHTLRERFEVEVPG